MRHAETSTATPFPATRSDQRNTGDDAARLTQASTAEPMSRPSPKVTSAASSPNASRRILEKMRYGR
jgi:hypothetical protein